jgi:hypothetical protein
MSRCAGTASTLMHFRASGGYLLGQSHKRLLSV